MGDPHNPAAVRAASQPAKFPRKFHGFFLLRFYIKFILQNCIFRLVAPSGILEQDSGSWRPGFRIRLPLGCHRGFRTLRAAGLRARSGATMFFSLRERMDRSSARVPQWFPHPESGWITRPLGCHRVFLTTRTHGSLVRSGATMVSAPGEVLDYAPARGGGGVERGGEGMMVSKKLNLKS